MSPCQKPNHLSALNSIQPSFVAFASCLVLVWLSWLVCNITAWMQSGKKRNSIKTNNLSFSFPYSPSCNLSSSSPITFTERGLFFFLWCKQWVLIKARLCTLCPSWGAIFICSSLTRGWNGSDRPGRRIH